MQNNLPKCTSLHVLLIIICWMGTLQLKAQNSLCGGQYYDRSSELDAIETNREIKILDDYGTEFLPSELAYVNPPAPSPTFLILPATTTCQVGLFTLHFSNEPTANPNYGFFDPVSGANRRNVVCQVFNDLSVLLEDVIPSNSGRVHIWVGSDLAYTASFPNHPVLPTGVGGMASQFYCVPNGLNNAIIDGEVYKTIRGGQNSFRYPAGFIPENSDGIYHGCLIVNLNATSNWYTDFSNTNIGASQSDMYSVILHEAIHLLGFSSCIGNTGQSKWSNTASDVFFRFDKFLFKNNTTLPLISYSSPNNWNYTGGLNPLAQNCNSPNNIIFNGVNNINQAVYNSTTWSDGSNLSHFGCSGSSICDIGYNAPNSSFVMNPCSGSGISGVKRHPNPQEVQTLCDLGYILKMTGGIIAYGTNASNTSIYKTYSACSNLCQASGVSESFGTTFNTPITVNFSDILSNDQGGYLNGVINDIFVISPNAGTVTTTGTSYSSSFTFTPSPNYSGLAVLGYYPRCNGSSINGSLTYIFIYIENPPLPSCTNTGDCNLICNGDFEFGDKSSAYGDLDVQGINNNTPDLYFGISGQVCEHDFYRSTVYDCNGSLGNCAGGTSLLSLAPSGGNQFIGIAGHPSNIESFHLRLRKSMTVGNSYQLTFYSRVETNVCSPVTLGIYGDGQSPCPISQTTQVNGSLSTCGFQAATLGQVTISTPTWTKYTLNITPTKNITDLVFSLNAGVQPGTGSLLYGYFDNFELIQTNIPKIAIIANSTTIFSCGTNQQTINYQVCLDAGQTGTNTIPITLQVGLPSTINLGSGSNFNNSGQYVIPIGAISTTSCVNLTLNFSFNNNAVVGQPYIISIGTMNANACVQVNATNTVNATQISNPLTVTTTVNNNNPNIGDILTYTIQVCNSSLTPVNNVVITDVIPSGLTVQNLNGFSQVGNTLSKTINISAAPSIGNPSCQTATFTVLVNNSCALIGTSCATVVTSSNNCSSIQSCVALTLTPKSVSIKSSATGNCLTSTLLTAIPSPAGTYTYQWKLNNINITGATTTTYTPTQSGNYTVEMTDGTACTFTSNTLAISVNVLAAISPTTINICSGTSTSLTASGGTTYTWSTGATTAAISVAPTISTNYTVTVKDGNNCSATASRIVNVPTLAINPNPAQFCPGGSIVLSATCSQPINSYAWLLNTANNTPTFTRTTFGTVSLRVTAGTSPVCTLTTSISVTPKSTPSLSLLPVSANCATGTMTLGGTPTAQGGSGTYTYVWSPATGLSSTTVANPTRTGTAGLPLTYAVTVTDASSNCTATATQVAQNSVYGFLEILDGQAASAGRVVSDLAVDGAGDVYAAGWFENDIFFQNDGYNRTEYFSFPNTTYKGFYVGKYSGCNVPSYQWKYVSSLNDVACAEVAPPFVGEGSCSQPYTPHIALANSKIYMAGTQNASGTRALISRLTTAGATDYESFQPNIAITDVESDSSNNVYITGFATTATATLGGTTFNSGELFIAQINTASSTLAFNWVYKPLNGTVKLLSSDGLPALATATSGATNYLVLSTGKYLQAYTTTATSPTPLGAILITTLSPSKGNRTALNTSIGRVFLLNSNSIYTYRFQPTGLSSLPLINPVSTSNLAYDIKVNGTDLYVINYSNTQRYTFTSSTTSPPALSTVWTAGAVVFSPCYTGQTLYTTANGFDRCIAIDPNVATNNRIYIGGGHLNCALKTMSTVYSVHKTDGIPYGWVNRINNATGVFFKTEEEETSSEPIVNTITTEIGFEIYPNPVNGELHFVRHGGGNQLTEITITDLLGRVVKRLQQLADAETLYQIDMSDLANDTYLVRIKTEQEQVVKKIIKTAN